MTCKKFRECSRYELGRYECDHAFTECRIGFTAKQTATLVAKELGQHQENAD